MSKKEKNIAKSIQLLILEITIFSVENELQFNKFLEELN